LIAGNGRRPLARSTAYSTAIAAFGQPRAPAMVRVRDNSMRADTSCCVGGIALRSGGGKSNIADLGWESSVSPLQVFEFQL
jgi:hypothetical protein